MPNISGTYIDAPYHCFEEGDFQVLEGEELKGVAVLCHSGYDKKYMTPEYEINVPYLTLEGAKWLMEREVAFVGIDTPFVDNYNTKDDADYPGDVVHDEILGTQFLIKQESNRFMTQPVLFIQVSYEQ